MAEKKVTIMEQYEATKAVLAKAERPDLVAFIEGRMAVHAKKVENRKPTKTQEANEGLKTRIVEILTKADKPMTVTEILNTDPEALVNGPKVTALVTALKNEGKVVREQDKKKVYFTIPK